MDQEQLSRWRPSKGQLLWTGAAVALMIGAVIVGYRYGITLWDWIKLLIVPAVIAGGGLWFNRQQRDRELEIANQRTNEDRYIAAQRTKDEQKITDQRRQDDALQAYLDQMGQLLLDKDRPLREAQVRDEPWTLARARTLTVLARLNGPVKGRLCGSYTRLS